MLAIPHISLLFPLFFCHLYFLSPHFTFTLFFFSFFFFSFSKFHNQLTPFISLSISKKKILKNKWILLLSISFLTDPLSGFQKKKLFFSSKVGHFRIHILASRFWDFRWWIWRFIFAWSIFRVWIFIWRFFLGNIEVV